MVTQKFAIQPAWSDFIIFWGGIVSTLALAVIIQMELSGYTALTWQSLALALGALVAALVQVGRTNVTISKTAVVINRILPSNQLTIAPTDIKAVVTDGVTLTLLTRPYGRITLIRLRRMAPVTAALAAVHVTVTSTKGD